MDLFIVLAYAVVYFVGYYGAYFLNLVSRRVVVRNLRLAGLSLLVIAAAVVTYFIEVNAPETASVFSKGYVQGRFAAGPALLVALFVGARMWLDSRKLRKGGQ